MKNQNITKKEIAENIANKLGLKQIEVKAVINMFFDQIIHKLKEGNNVELRGFGRFKVKKMNERIARNPKTGETCMIPKRIRPYCQISDSVKEIVNGSDS